MGRYSTVLVVILSAFIVPAICDSDSKEASVPITGKDLVDMGRKFNKPLLRLIGKSLMDLECRSQACSQWTEWSTCEIFIGKFGVKKRTRHCGENGGCDLNTGPRNETDTIVCFDNCPSDYEKTKEGFCLKYYNTTKLTKDDAETSCSNAGGHLININSERKWAAFVSYMSKQGPNDVVYIDGERKANTSPWVFTYQTDITGYTNWGDDDPDNGSNDLGLYAQHYAKAGVYDNTCTATRSYMCENV